MSFFRLGLPDKQTASSCHSRELWSLGADTIVQGRLFEGTDSNGSLANWSQGAFGSDSSAMDEGR